MQPLKTHSRNRPFEFERLPAGNIEIRYGNGFGIRIDAKHIQNLIATYRGQTVELGTSRDNPPEGSIGEWLKKKNVTKTAVASYLGPILVHEKLATWGPKRGKALTLKIL